jgi:hypothetical protein
VAQQNTVVTHLALGYPAGKYFLTKMSKSGQGQHSVYSGAATLFICDEDTGLGQLIRYVQIHSCFAGEFVYSAYNVSAWLFA